MVLFKNESDFSKAYKASQPKGFYLLYGSEHYLIDNWSKKITEPFEGEGAFNLLRLDGKNLDCDDLHAAVEALPLFAQQKCVAVKGLDIGKLSNEDKDKLEEIVSDVPDYCILVISGYSPEFDTRTAIAKKLIKTAADKGMGAEFGAPDNNRLTSFLKNRAKKNKCILSSQMARKILETCENDMNHLANEVDKICAYAGEGEITQEHIEKVATPQIQARVFDLSKCIQIRNPQRAMEILGDLFYLREEPIRILAALNMAFVDMYRARIAKSSGISPAKVAEMFSYKSSYRVTNAFSTRFSEEQLEKSLNALLDCEVKMKSTGADNKILLEQTVIALFNICR